MKLALVNLDNPVAHYYELHRADCQDLGKKAGTRYEVASIEEAAKWIDGLNDGYEDAVWTIEEHAKIFGCVRGN